MKICLIGPGEMTIPPKGWGAIETLIAEYAAAMRQAGHEVCIVNTPNFRDSLREVEDFSPDFLHCHSDIHLQAVPYFKKSDGSRPAIATTSHYGYLEKSDKNDWFRKLFVRFAQNEIVFALTERSAEIYKSFGAKKICITPNYINSTKFHAIAAEDAKRADRTICLGKIDGRKRQGFIQRICDDVVFAGQVADKNFDLRKNYIGSWDRQTVYEKLGHFGSLILFSESEVQPLVVMEAMSAGLGVVVSEEASAGLDLSLPFVRVISNKNRTEAEWGEALKKANKEVREYSLENRDKIRAYAYEKFDWKNYSKYDNLIQQITHAAI